MFPLVPVTARTEVPAVAVEATLTVNVLLPLPPATLAGEKLAVTPVGSPLTDMATGELNPFALATARVKEVEPPTFTLAPIGLGIRVKLAAETVTVNSRVRVNPPPVPTTAIGKVPPAALAVTVTVMVTGAEHVREGDEKDTVTPEGNPAAESATGEVKPPCALMVRVTEAVPPGVTARLEELEPSEKLDASALLQLLTSRKASTEPRPVVMS